MSFLYDFVFTIFALFSIPKFLLRLNQAKDAQTLMAQRFGFISKSLTGRLLGKQVLWLHAVSVGEVNAAREWIERFLNEHPEWFVALSTTTPTGQTVADSLGFRRLIVFYAPFDLSWVVRRVLRSIQPKLMVLMETEIWPNLIRCADQAGVPVGIINGRISPRSFKRYQFVRTWLASILGHLSFCLVQTERDKTYFEKLGMPHEKLILTGNMKFDLNGKKISPLHNRPKGIEPQSLVYIGGSTHRNEEEILLSVFNRLRPRFQNLILILAPRHPERFGEVESAIKQFNFRYCLYSNLEQTSDSYDVLLIDQMGVLASLYSIADLVFIGGSFVKRGGQNPIEAAGFKKPILHGPNVTNFHEVYRLLDEQNAALVAASENDLFQQSTKLLEQPQLRNEMGARAWASVQSMKGATAKTLAYVTALLGKSI